MSKRVSQEEWDARAAAVGIDWLKPVNSVRATAPARCSSCDHRWEAWPGHIRDGQGCPKCGQQRGGRERRTSQDTWNARASAIGVEWVDPVGASGQRVTARCLNCRHEWQAWPSHIQRGQGCPQCSGRFVSQAEWNRRAAAADVEWLSPVGAARSPINARCTLCGYKWDAVPSKLQQGAGCPRCSSQARAQGLRQTQSTWNKRAAAVDLVWLDEVDGSGVKTLARCLKCGYEWLVVPNTVSRGQSCPKCAEYGFNPAAPAYLYLMVKDDGVAQIGITGDGKAMTARMARHKRNGYAEHSSWRFDVGADARAVERETIRRWREDDDLLPAAPHGEDGWTETVHTQSLSLEEIVSRINALVRTRPD